MFRLPKQGWYGKRLEENIEKSDHGDYRSIPWIFCVLAEPHNPSRILAADALCRVLQTLDFDDIVTIDWQMRQTSSMEWSIDWSTISIDNLFSPNMNAEQRRSVVIFASFNPNGYIREQAVKKLTAYKATLPFMILRLNDWVFQVREAADFAVRERMNHLSLNELSQSLPYAEKIKGCKHSQSVWIIFNYLTNPDNRTELIDGLNSARIRTRRICIYALLDTAPFDHNTALSQLRREPDPFLRKLLFNRLLASNIDMDEYARLFLRDRYPLNRLLALQYFNSKRTDQQNLIAISIHCLSDKNASVRSLARQIVTSINPEFDFISFYQSHLTPFTIPSILGLGETGNPDNCAEMEVYLCSPSPGIISAAITALMKLNPEKYSDTAMGLLDHPNSGVVKTSQRLIIKYQQPDYPKIKHIYDNTVYLHSKIKCAALLFTAPKWQRIIYILQILPSQEDFLPVMALQAVYRWISSFNNYYGSPSP